MIKYLNRKQILNTLINTAMPIEFCTKYLDKKSDNYKMT